MRASVAGIFNKHGFSADISIMQDAVGDYLCIIFSHDDYIQFGQDEGALAEVAQYLINVKKALESHGARVTFVVTGGSQ